VDTDQAAVGGLGPPESPDPQAGGSEPIVDQPGQR